MQKYWRIFTISFQEEFVYRLNFVMWRIRNIFQILITFYLWSTIYTNSNTVFFGYDRSRILTYIFGILIVRSFVLSARAMDISNDIAQGNLSNYLLKPMSYFKYWFTRDIASKALNLIFASAEFLILFIIFKPQFYLQTDIYTLITFLISVCIAVVIYFCILFIVSSVPFWAPELGWASQFLVVIVIIEFLSGSLFPIDILPAGMQKVIMATPFPYMIFFPVEVYLGKITGTALITGFVISIAWAVILWFLMRMVWNKGLSVYQAFGR